MLKRMVRGIKGFTLIELLAVMAIVAILAGIVSVSVSGSGQTSRDTQVREDANTAGSSVVGYRDDQSVTELFENKTVDVDGFIGIVQQISNQWPEIFITDFYDEIFVDVSGGATTTVNSMTFLNDEGNNAFKASVDIPADVFFAVSVDADGSDWTVTPDTGTAVTLNATTPAQTNITVGNIAYNFAFAASSTASGSVVTVTLNAGGAVGTLTHFTAVNVLTDFNAVDWDTLDDGGYSTTLPESLFASSAITDSITYHTYLWLLEKGIAQGSTGTVSSRGLAVYVLTQVAPAASGKFDLTFQRLD